MRKVIWMLALFLILACAAQAEDGYFTQKDDLYYHISANCGGGDAIAPLSAAAAKEFDKYPCPICVPDDTQWQAGIAAVARGNTIIVRMSDRWLEEADLAESFGFSPAEPQPIDDAPALIAEYLHGDAYNQFLKKIRTEDISVSARKPLILSTAPDQSLLRMSVRHIGSAWYTAFRPEHAFGDTWDLEWRIEGYTIQAADDQLTIEYAGAAPEDGSTIPVPQFSTPAAFSAQFDGCRIEVYTVTESDIRANVAVVTQFDADTDYLQNSVLCIGDQVRIPINGYADGADGVFCCVLTDAEYAHLAGGAKANVQPPDYMQRAEFDNSPYAAVRRGTGGMGIVDASGAFVLPPEYLRIERCASTDYPSTVPIPFFCTATDGAITILDSQTLDLIVLYAAPDKPSNVKYINPSVFEIQDSRGVHIQSMATGSTLIDVTSGDSIDGRYRCMADGYPERLVLRGADGARLITLTGDSVSDAYPRITPLIWKKGRGIFLVEDWDSGNEQIGTHYYFERGKPLRMPDTRWHCGLMDENGRIITPVVHTSIEVTDDLRILLDGANGTIIAPFE